MKRGINRADKAPCEAQREQDNEKNSQPIGRAPEMTLFVFHNFILFVNTVPLRFFQIKRQRLRHPIIAHGHAVEHVGHVHGHAIVRD